MKWFFILLPIIAVIIEWTIIGLYTYIKKTSPNYTAIFIMATKVAKLLLAVVVIWLISALSKDINIKIVAIAVIVVYLIGSVVETIFFLKKK